MQFSTTCADYPIYNIAIRVVLHQEDGGVDASAAGSGDVLDGAVVRQGGTGAGDGRHGVHSENCGAGIDTDSKKRAWTCTGIYT